MSEEQLQAIRARLDAASPAPWNADFTDDDFHVRPNNACSISSMHVGSNHTIMWVDEAENAADIEFIVYARVDIALLLAEVDRLRKLVNENA